MVKRLAYPLIILFVSVLFFYLSGFYTKTPKGPPKRNVKITVQEADPFDIILTSNATTGYSWQLSGSPDKAIIQVIGSSYNVPETELVGVGGTEIWSFKALRAGKTTLFFKYVRPWEKNEPPANVAGFEIIVKSGG